MNKLLGILTSTVFVPFLLINNSVAQGTHVKQLASNEINSSIDLELSDLIKRHKLTGTPIAVSAIPNINSPKAQLGMKLFFSKSLSGDKQTACVSCHHPMLGGGDNLSLPIGVAASESHSLGSKRQTKGNKHTGVPRNAPTIFNVVFWNKMLFHDGRIKRLANNEITTPDKTFPEADLLAGESLVQAQARFPITSPDEMRGEFLKTSFNQTLRRTLAKRLQKNWLNEFRIGFNDANGTAEDLITEQNFSEAIAAYEQSQVFINNPWKAYVEGDKTALSDSAKQGAKLFLSSQSEGGAGCASCHSGNFFSDEKTYNTAMPQIGIGKKKGKTNTNDFGVANVTKNKNDRFKFRTPSLLNVEVTGPWGHAGSYTTLEAITEHMLWPVKSAKNYDVKQLTQKSVYVKDVKENTLEALNSGLQLPPKPHLDKKDMKNIVSFLKSLTDPCVKDRDCMSKWIPDSDMNDPDGLTLHGVDSRTGKRL